MTGLYARMWSLGDLVTTGVWSTSRGGFGLLIVGKPMYPLSDPRSTSVYLWAG